MKKLLIGLFLIIPLIGNAAPPSRTNTYTSGTTIDSTAVTRNEDAIFSYLQAGVDTLATNAVSSTSMIADGVVTSADINNDSIVNADINSAAAIVDTKLATITTLGAVNTSALTTTTGAIGQVLVHDGTNWTAISAGSDNQFLGSALSGTPSFGSVPGSAFTLLSTIPSGAGVIPAANIPSGEFFIGSFEIDTTTATGTQEVIGVGFTATNCIFYMFQDASTTEVCWGLDNASTTKAMFMGTDNSYNATSTYSIYDTDAAGTYAGEINSFNADGFQIGWTKATSPTGTLTINFIAFN